MKNTKFFTSFIMTAFLIMLSFSLFSQTYLPTQQRLFYNNNGLIGGYYLLDKHEDFQQKRYNIGYHWDWGYKMSQVLFTDQIHVFQPIVNYATNQIELNDTNKYLLAYNSKIIINTPYLSNHWEIPFQLSAAKALVYEPTYFVDISNPIQL